MDTVGDLLDALRLPNWIQSFSNIGKQSQREIVQKMESLGLADDSYASVRKIKISVRNVECYWGKFYDKNQSCKKEEAFYEFI